MAGELILIVEDNFKNLKLFRDLLELKGFKVLGAQTGKEAINILGEQKPELILMDILLPDINGLEAVKLLKAKPDTKDIPIVALTSLAMPDDRAHCLEAGCLDHIAKPIDTKGFVEKVEGIIRRAKGKKL
ncbi:MAG: response regulator [bacterium]